jgi:acetyl-CoA carboxylase biotin carboxyl carrier protein
MSRSAVRIRASARVNIAGHLWPSGRGALFAVSPIAEPSTPNHVPLAARRVYYGRSASERKLPARLSARRAPDGGPNNPMPESGLDLQAIARLIELVENHGLEELSVEDEGLRIVVRQDAPQVRQPPVDAAPPAGASLQAASAPPQVRDAIASPMVGVFYRAPGPDEPAYVEVGQHIDIGQTIGVIEAMKVFSEVPADRAGVCIEIVAQSGQLVQAGAPLLYLSPEA